METIPLLVGMLGQTQEERQQFLARVHEDAVEGLDDLAWVQDVLEHKQRMSLARYRAVGSSNQSASQVRSAQAHGESSDAPVASAAAAASQASNQSCLCPPSCESTDGASSDSRSRAKWKAAHEEMARTRTQASSDPRHLGDLFLKCTISEQMGEMQFRGQEAENSLP